MDEEEEEEEEEIQERTVEQEQMTVVPSTTMRRHTLRTKTTAHDQAYLLVPHFHKILPNTMIPSTLAYARYQHAQ
jgi:hypothetical protein